MVVRIRLQRFGMKYKPFYRIVAADSRCPRNGRFLERLGTYNSVPMNDGVKEILFNSDRIKYWISVGAQPSERVSWLLWKCGILPPPPQRLSMKHLLPKSLKSKK